MGQDMRFVLDDLRDRRYQVMTRIVGAIRSEAFTIRDGVVTVKITLVECEPFKTLLAELDRLVIT